VEKSPKMWPNPFFVKINAQLLPWKDVVQMFNYFCDQKTAESNKSPNTPKLSHTDHPDWESDCVGVDERNMFWRMYFRRYRFF
jgi:hypothetical protein